MKNINSNKKELSPGQCEELLRALKDRFEKNMNRHKGLEWAKVEAKLDLPAGGEKLWSLNEMERTGGEPDVVGFDKKIGRLSAGRQEYIAVFFVDFSFSLSYDWFKEF